MNAKQRYYRKHRERILLRQRAQYRENPAKHIAQVTAYMATPEGRVRHCINKSRRDAKVHGYLPCTATVQELLESLTGYCAICFRDESELPRRLYLDHDHETGKFRGWLCQHCNTAIGMMADEPGRLRSAARYLEAAA